MVRVQLHFQLPYLHISPLHLSTPYPSSLSSSPPKAAQFIRFQLPELELFLKKFDEEEAKQVEKLKQK